MLLYHLGISLDIDIELVPDFKKTNKIINPLIKVLEIGEDAFKTTMLNAMYFREVMRKSKMREWSDCSKWGT